MTDQIGSGTAQGVIDYLDSLVDKGRSRPGVVTPLKIALTKVLEATEGEDNWGATDITSLDIDDAMIRFKNKTLSKYTAASYAAYQSRVTRAVNWYKNFLANPGWVPKENARSSKLGDGGAEKNTKPMSSKRSSQLTATIAPDHSQNPVQEAVKIDVVSYPFPLANGEIARVYMPKGVTKADVKRLAAFLDALVIEGSGE